jgi:hypothetical protein
MATARRSTAQRDTTTKMRMATCDDDNDDDDDNDNDDDDDGNDDEDGNDYGDNVTGNGATGYGATGYDATGYDNNDEDGNYIINIEVHFKSHINACAGILKVISKVVSH